MTKEFRVESEAETEAAGGEIARLLPPTGVVYVRGDLGSGKTTLIRAIAAALGADAGDVSSPTFAIVHEYDVPRGAGASGPRVSDHITHLDCYRLSDSLREWEEIGLLEILRASELTFIEWPKEQFSRYATPVAEIDIESGDEETRTIRFRTP